MESSAKEKVIACKLTSPELQKRRVEVIASIKGKIGEKLELDNGYKYIFEGTDQVIDELISFIKTERQCCEFFNFDVHFADNDISLSISGPKGAKEFIKTEMGL